MLQLLSGSSDKRKKEEKKNAEKIKASDKTAPPRHAARDIYRRISSRGVLALYRIAKLSLEKPREPAICRLLLIDPALIIKRLRFIRSSTRLNFHICPTQDTDTCATSNFANLSNNRNRLSLSVRTVHVFSCFPPAVNLFTPGLRFSARSDRRASIGKSSDLATFKIVQPTNKWN